MGERNSSLTRVQPVFDVLLNRWPSGDRWVQRLCDMAAQTRTDVQLPNNIGPLLESETPRTPETRLRKVFERIVTRPEPDESRDHKPKISAISPIVLN
jgi:hypothetical protein